MEMIMRHRHANQAITPATRARVRTIRTIHIDLFVHILSYNIFFVFSNFWFPTLFVVRFVAYSASPLWYLHMFGMRTCGTWLPIAWSMRLYVYICNVQSMDVYSERVWSAATTHTHTCKRRQQHKKKSIVACAITIPMAKQPISY